MTPEQALKIIHDVTSQVAMKKADHLTVENALMTLKALIPAEQKPVLVDANKKPDSI